MIQQGGHVHRPNSPSMPPVEASCRTGWPARFIALALTLAVVVGLVAGCAASTAPNGSPTATESPVPTKLTVGLGYIPSVQFAQFYYAEQQGYYTAAGLEVELQHKTDPELITLLGQGAVDIGLGDGTSIIPAVSQGIPVRYVATIYARFPNVVVATSASGIVTAADLKGHSLGTPGRFGSSWIMLQLLLRSVGLTPEDLDLRLYPDFGQATALQQGAVDAATGFANNEPIRLEAAGVPTRVLRVDDVAPLPGPGLCVGTGTLGSKREAIRAFTAATLRAMDEIASDPQKGLDAAVARVPELAADREGQLAVLRATVEMWSSAYTRAHGRGAIDRSAWQSSIDLMRALPEHVVPNPVTVDQVVAEGIIDG